MTCLFYASQSPLQFKSNDFYNLSKTDFPWTDDLESKLVSVFHLETLRPMQRQTMNATLSKEDALLVMPTGGGKSLCFQLPAVVSGGVTLVVSPLVSLMEDQHMALQELDVPVAMLTANTGKDELKTIQVSIFHIKLR